MDKKILKALEKLSKIKKTETAIKDGTYKPRGDGMKTLVRDLAAQRKREQKARAKFAQSILDGKNEAINLIEDYKRIIANLHIIESAKEEAEKVFSSYELERAKLVAQIRLLDMKVEAGQRDIDAVYSADEAFGDFRIAVEDYARDCLEHTRQPDAEDIRRLFDTHISADAKETLTRGTTIFQSVEYVWKRTLGNLADASQEEDTTAEFLEGIERLFSKYNVAEISEEEI